MGINCRTLELLAPFRGEARPRSSPTLSPFKNEKQCSLGRWGYSSLLEGLLWRLGTVSTERSVLRLTLCAQYMVALISDIKGALHLKSKEVWFFFFLERSKWLLRKKKYCHLFTVSLCLKFCAFSQVFGGTVCPSLTGSPASTCPVEN